MRWGSTIWAALHTLSFAYPNMPTAKERDAAKNLLYGVAALLPCAECRRHSHMYIKHHLNEEALASRKAFARWMFEFHESVNRKLKKESHSYEEAEKEYMGILGDSCAGDPQGCRIIDSNLVNHRPYHHIEPSPSPLCCMLFAIAAIGIVAVVVQLHSRATTAIRSPNARHA